MRLSLLDNRRNFLLYLDEDKVIPKYTVTWKNWDGTDLYVDTKAAEGGIPGYAGPTPTKPATQTVRYEFTGWTPSVVAVTGDTTYTAIFTEVPIMVQVQWLNYDSSVIKMEEVQAGTKPTYSGTNPTKPSTTQYRYNFTGWSPNPAVIYEDTVYTAQFQEVPNTVTATFIKDSSDGGGTIKTVAVNYGETPVFGSADPTSTKGVPPEITFEGWEPVLGPITQNTTYTAVFKDNRPYTVQFLARVIEEYTDIHAVDLPTGYTLRNAVVAGLVDQGKNQNEIETDYYINSASRFIIKCKLQASVPSDGWRNASIITDHSADGYGFAHYVHSWNPPASYYAVYRGGIKYDVNVDINETTIYNLVFWPEGKIYRDGTAIANGIIDGGKTSGKHMYIFGDVHTGSELYLLEIYEGDTLVAKYVPCTRDSDMISGVYDIVGHKFFGNANLTAI